jgi:hypothetical protein
VIARAHIATAFAAAIALLAPAIARADDSTAARNAAAAREGGRPHALAEVNTGFLLLPGALVCPKTLDQSTCKRGEFSFAVGLQNVYRFGSWGFGAGIQWATTLRSDAANGDPSLEREHSRRYFLVEGLVRYYFIRMKAWEWWAGANTGVVVVNDSWSVKADREPYSDTEYVGPRAATLGTEGFSLGASIGGEWTFLGNWSLGPSLRYSSWFLPTKPAMSPTLDVASLAGRQDMFDIGIRIMYRIAL